MTSLRSIEDIRKAANALLLKADVAERLPTPVDELVAAAELMQVDDYEIDESVIRQMPRYLRGIIRGARRKITGLLDRRERIIQIDQSLDDKRQKFVKLHEVSHDIFQWQKDLVVLADTPKTLSPSIKRLFEQEANQGAAELFFQVGLLQRIARDYPVHRTTPFELGEMFGSSAHSAFRYGLTLTRVAFVASYWISISSLRAKYFSSVSSVCQVRSGYSNSGIVLSSKNAGL